MKICSQCFRVYNDETAFCLTDGMPLADAQLTTNAPQEAPSLRITAQPLSESSDNSADRVPFSVAGMITPPLLKDAALLPNNKKKLVAVSITGFVLSLTALVFSLIFLFINTYPQWSFFCFAWLMAVLGLLTGVAATVLRFVLPQKFGKGGLAIAAIPIALTAVFLSGIATVRLPLSRRYLGFAYKSSDRDASNTKFDTSRTTKSSGGNYNGDSSSSNTTSGSSSEEPRANADFSTPTKTYETRYRAAKTGDIDLFKKTFSKERLDFINRAAREANTTADQIIRQLLKDDPGMSRMPEVRNEIISGSRATLEANGGSGTWVKESFVKEEDGWKLGWAY